MAKVAFTAKEFGSPSLQTVPKRYETLLYLSAYIISIPLLYTVLSAVQLVPKIKWLNAIMHIVAKTKS